MRRHLAVSLLLPCAATLPAILCSDEPSPAPPAREVRMLMGTTAEVEVDGLADPGPALDAAFAALTRVDDRMSLWKPTELRALNDTGSGVVSLDTFIVIRRALDVAAASHGAFDPTVEPLVRAGGGLDDPARSLSPDERRTLLERVDYTRVRLDAAHRSVRLQDQARLVLDGLAKGYAADLALAALREAGASSGLVDLGGSSIAHFGDTLRVELDDPTGESRPWAVFHVVDAVGSSGGRHRPGHILDPRTGEPPRHVLQATVVADTALEADALSTALLVLGAEDGLALVRRRGAAGLVAFEEDGRRVVVTTPGFATTHGLLAAPDVEVRE